jgi:hypothetical protein
MHPDTKKICMIMTILPKNVAGMSPFFLLMYIEKSAIGWVCDPTGGLPLDCGAGAGRPGTRAEDDAGAAAAGEDDDIDAAVAAAEPMSAISIAGPVGALVLVIFFAGEDLDGLHGLQYP